MQETYRLGPGVRGNRPPVGDAEDRSQYPPDNAGGYGLIRHNREFWIASLQITDVETKGSRQQPEREDYKHWVNRMTH